MPTPKKKTPHLNCITINTDASFHPKLKVGGYAFYIVCDLFKITKSGMFKTNPKNPGEAEMMCMANALHTLLAQKELPSTNLIIINSDALMTFEKIKLKSKNEIGRKVALKLRAVRRAMALRGAVYPKWEFRHVKAHNGTSDARSYVNDWCDTEAKKWMRLASSLIQENHQETTWKE